jgi:hypothetical protein
MSAWPVIKASESTVYAGNQPIFLSPLAKRGPFCA